MAPRVIRWLLVLLCAGGAAVVARSVASAPDTYPVADTATTSLYALRAAHGELQVGSYSRFGWNHPGPLLYQALALPYVASGRKEIAIKWTALALNLAWLAATLVAVGRRSPRLALCLALALVPLLWREQRLLVFAWNPFAPVLALPCAVALAAGLEARSRWALAGVAGALSFCVQSHAGLAVPAAVVAVAALVIWSGVIRSVGEIWWRAPALWLAAATILALWATPLADEVAHRPGNLESMVRFLLDPGQPHPTWSRAFAAAGYMTAGPFQPRWEATFVELPAALPAWAAAAFVVQVLAVVSAAWWHGARGQAYDAAFAAIAGAITAITPIAAHGIVGPMSDYLLLWATAIGGLNAAIVASALAARIRVAPGVVRPLVAATLIGWAVIGGQRLIGKHAEQARDTTLRALAMDLRRYCAERRLERPLVDFDPESWRELAGLVLQFAKADVPLAVSAPGLYLVGPPFAANGREDARFYLMPTAATVPAELGRVEWVTTRGLLRVVRVQPETSVVGGPRPQRGPRAAL